MGDAENQAVTNFREFLRIKSVHPNPDYASAVTFLKKQAAELELPCEVLECLPGKPVVIMTWKGANPALPSLVLNCHTDVVPVYPESWKHDPFEAVKEENGDIYARGTQDMKCVGIQYLEAIRRFKKEGKEFLRTIHLLFIPDEEIGGKDGMKAFLRSEHFKTLNLGFALDEGLANPTDAFTVFYGERAPWCTHYCWVARGNVQGRKYETGKCAFASLQHDGVPFSTDCMSDVCFYHTGVKVTCAGNPGHGSRFIQNNAAEKFRKVINSFLAYRDAQEKKLNENPELRLGDVTTVNMNIIKGGVQPNVVPNKFSAVFDIRITPTQNLSDFEAMVAGWCSEAGTDVTYEFIQKMEDQTVTSTSRQDPWWNAFMEVMDKHGHKVEKEIFPAATDSRYLRELGFPAIGFSPMNNTPILLHDHNEFLNEGVFLRGIDVYYHLIPQLANVPTNGK